MNEMYEEFVTEIRSWQLCRICAEQSEDLINIYDERGISMELEEKINHYLPITVTADDDLPLFMCYSCITKLNTVHELIVSCVQSNDRLNQLLQMEQKLALTEIEANDQNEWILLHLEPAYKKFEENDAGVANHRSEVIQNCASKDSIKIKVNSTEFKLTCSVATQTERILRKTIKTASRNDKSRTVNHTSYTECEKKTPIVYCDTDNSDKCSKITEFECERLEYLNRETVCFNIKEQTSSPYKVVQNTDRVKNNNEDTHIKDDAICNAKDIQNFVEHTSPNCAKSYAENKVLGIVVQNQHLSNINGSLESNAKDLSNNIFNKSEHFAELDKHKCKVCGVIYVNDVELKGHTCNENDNSRPILCNHCERKFQSIELFNNHMKKNTCTHCGQHFTSEDLLRMHKLSHRDTKVWHCNYENCRKVFLHRSSLDIHKTTHTSESPYLCDVCGKCFTHVSHLSSHKRSHLDEISKKKHKCELCGKGLRSVSRLRDHMRFHTGERPFSCDCCPKQFRTKEKLKQHVAIHGNIRPFKCTICSFSSVRRGNLTKHFKTHSRNNYQCRLGLHSHHSTSSDEKLKKNKKRATNTSDFQCSECGKFLSTKASLEMHERMHAGIKPFLCTECGKQFSQKSGLEYHKRTHTGERPYSCKFCGRGFNSKAGKDKHELIHTGEKPYRCNECDTSFRSYANLHQHKKIHEDSRAFPCSQCDKRFRRREAMQIHMRIHTGERPYSCPICDRSFSQKGDLTKHCTRAHSMKTARKNNINVGLSKTSLSISNKKELELHIGEMKVNEKNSISTISSKN